MNDQPKTEQIDEFKKDGKPNIRLDISLSLLEIAERRCSELADEFTRLEVQIASVLFAFSGFLFSAFNQPEKPFSTIVVFVLKFMFGSSLFFLILSLIIGLLHLKSKEIFWESAATQRLIRLRKWLEAVENKVPFKEALAYHEGTGLGQGISARSPSWSWIIQTICLGLAVILLFVLFLVFLFH